MLGTRGVPAAHGGFETAAAVIGQELVSRGWRVVVYCQSPEARPAVTHDTWRGIERVHLPERFDGPLGTVWFDALSVRDAARHRDVCLSFGYNTAVLSQHLRRRGVPLVINMDGVEWKRARWTPAQRKFLQLNERIACRTGDALIADHPVIAQHLSSFAPLQKLTTITYGADPVHRADPALVRSFGLRPRSYVTLVARPVRENSILEIVRTYSRRPRPVPLVVVGHYDRANAYEAEVLDAASPDVVFVGAQYDPAVLTALRYFSVAYLHGHTVGGTNPSLVEALGCGNPVIAHANPYNRWVAGDAALYFTDETGLERALGDLFGSEVLGATLSRRAYDRHAQEFDWSRIVDRYESLLTRHLPAEQALVAPSVRPAFSRLAI